GSDAVGCAFLDDQDGVLQAGEGRLLAPAVGGRRAAPQRSKVRARRPRPLGRPGHHALRSQPDPRFPGGLSVGWYEDRHREADWQCGPRWTRPCHCATGAGTPALRSGSYCDPRIVGNVEAAPRRLLTVAGPAATQQVETVLL